MKPIWGCKSLQMVVPNIFGRKMDLLWRNIILPAALLGCDVVVWIQKMCRKADSIHWWIIIFQIETTIKWGGQSHFQAHKKSHPSYQVGCSMVFPLYPQYIPMISPLYGAIRYFMGVTRKKHPSSSDFPWNKPTNRLFFDGFSHVNQPILVGGWPTPLKNMSSSMGRMTSHIL